MFKKLLFLYIFFFLWFNLNSQTTPFVNFRIFPSTITQTEPVVVFNPNNKTFMFASAYTINTASSFRSEGVYISTNGGLNWFGSDTCKGQLISNHGGDPGAIIDKNNVLILTHIGSVFTGMYSHYSLDTGRTWSTSYTITSQQPEDKGTSTTDDSPLSPYYGRSYASWVNFVTPYPVLISYTTNSGLNWSAASAINSPPPQRSSGGYIRTGTDGKVYVSWAGVSSSSPFTENYAGFAISTNGGVNWNVIQNVYAMNGINGTLTSKGNIRVNGIPRFEIDKTGGPRNGWIYMITAEKNLSPAGSDPDIILHRSTNGGLNWSSGIRVNQDALNNGKIQYCPAIDVDSTGAVNILYYDDRNTSSDSTEVYLSRSKDGGETFQDFVVSTHRFKPKPIVGAVSSYQGDFITIVSNGNKLFSYWMDDFSGIYQIWSCIIDISTIGITKLDNEIPDKFFLMQNYPNPFNPVTKIKFSIPEKTSASLLIYDISGRIIKEEKYNNMNPGIYEYDFNASGFASGIYFYKVRTDKYNQARKMILIK